MITNTPRRSRRTGNARGLRRATVGAAAAAALLVTASCGGESGATPGTATTSGLKPIDQTALQTLVDTTMADRMIPGGLVLLRGPHGEHVAAHGTTELGAEIAPMADTHVRIASISKSMTAASILLLAQDGKLSLTDPISKYVPEVPDGDAITISQLLEMRSGLYNYTDDPELSAGIDADHQRVWKPQELLAIAFSHPPNFAPGADYEYSNTNYALLGLVAERVDGKPLATVLQDQVFGPLGMTDSFLPPPDSVVLPDPSSHGYMYGSSAHVFGEGSPYTPEEQAAAHAGTLLPIDYTDVNHTFAFGTGGVISTANDLATFFTAYVGGGLLDPEYQALLINSLQLEHADKPGQYYGYGLSSIRWADNSIEFHGGETAGFNLFAGYDRTNQLAIVVWTNLTLGIDDGGANANQMMLDVLDQNYTPSPLNP